MKKNSVAILHYSAPPIIGGVEAVIKAHVKELVDREYAATVIAGRGDLDALPKGANYINVPEIDSQHLEILEISRELEEGRVPNEYKDMEDRLENILEPIFSDFDHLIIHNVFTKHFNLPLTGALHRMLEQGVVKHAIAWCHDFTWTSPSSGGKVFPGYPWDLLRTQRQDCKYVTISEERQQTLAGLLNCPTHEIKVVYNGVDPVQLLGLSEMGEMLVRQLGLLNSDINLLMPVRVTHAKNIEFALKVMAELKKNGIRPKLIVTGPPDPHDSASMDYYHSLQTMREDLNVVEEMRFIFESGPQSDQPFYIDETVVDDLYRVSDVMFMPSHREGFGMPVMEAGLVGIPIISREVPAAQELAKNEALIFTSDSSAEKVAEQIIHLLDGSPTSRMRRRVRQDYTWSAIFEDEIQPLLGG